MGPEGPNDPCSSQTGSQSKKAIDKKKFKLDWVNFPLLNVAVNTNVLTCLWEGQIVAMCKSFCVGVEREGCFLTQELRPSRPSTEEKRRGKHLSVPSELGPHREIGVFWGVANYRCYMPFWPLKNRVFLNLWFGKPMVCLWVAFHENDGNHENDENDEDNSDSYKQGVQCWNLRKSRKPRK